MTHEWIEGCAVVRIMFRDGLVVNFEDDNELVIKVPMRLTVPPVGSYPAEVVPVDPMATRDEERPLFDISGTTCTRALWNDDGSLHLEFSDAHRIDVPSDEHITAWELYGKYHGYVACLPHGKVRVLRHDLLEEK
ncbi:hypothetical protein A5791_16295 [Mycobacterium sp. 852002-51163_SCH5372311]|uniref:DUF6188 family protein n=1 Tax=Mycobacterium sp. 852002-51163_SCH5372311 TaxID=1834097 RepID=UPI0007FDBC85|nr:DUF6188 family protein [Mycobacterium sp. 852002-51163_SCH5372311]OBF90669.1 hypothetical protein A5791_16295 [Mycobacterium sp. 852002-51163_SCH5372311]